MLARETGVLACEFELVSFWGVQIPLYAVFKLWSSVISPMLGFGRGAGAPAESDADAGANGKETVSKRQEKLRKRQERGDPRVRVQTRS